MIYLIIGFICVILAFLFNKVGNSYLSTAVDPSEYYKGAEVAYFSGVVLIHFGLIIMVLP